MSKIVKSLYTTIAGQRTIHTIPVVKVITPTECTNENPVDQSLEEILSPDDILKEAQEKANRFLEETRQEAATAIAEAKRQAESIVSDAKRQAEQTIDEAWKAGYQTGFEEGKTAGESLYRNMIDQVLDMMSQFETDKKRYALQSEQQLVELACLIARKIIDKELEIDSAWVENTLKSALAELVDRSYVEVHAHPEDIPALVKVKDELVSQYASKMEIKFVPEPTVEKGGCILRTLQGAVDARIDTQLNEVKRALLDAAAALNRE